MYDPDDQRNSVAANKKYSNDRVKNRTFIGWTYSINTKSLTLLIVQHDYGSWKLDIVGMVPLITRSINS